MSGNDTLKCAAEGGCEPVVKRIEGLENMTYDKNTGITALNQSRVSRSELNKIIVGLFVLTIGGIVAGIFFFSDIRAMAKDYPKEKEKIEQKQAAGSERVAKLEEKVKAYDLVINKLETAATTLERVALNIENKGIASKKIKEYNTHKN